MSVLVTGAGGFLGSAVVRALVADGVEVVAVLRPGGSTDRLTTVAACPVAEVDLAAPDASARLRAHGPQAIVHVALDREAYRRVDPAYSELPLRAVLAALEGVPGARLVHTSSAWLLAPGDRLAEDAPVRPRTPYAHNKAHADELVPRLAHEAGVAWLILRPFNLFGRYEDRSRLVPHIVSRLVAGEPAELSHGAQVRDFNDVDAVARAFAAALRARADAYGSLYHIGSGRGTSARELAHLVAEQLGRPDLLRFGVSKTADDDVPVLVADPTRVRDAIGWSTPEPLEEVVRSTVAWWLERESEPRARVQDEVLT